MNLQRIIAIDSHTAGEPTRVVVAGGPSLGDGAIAERLAILRDRFDNLRAAVVNEPRGSDVLVGALLCEPSDPSCVAGVIFFNNVGYLGMCGHGLIGLVVTLGYLGRIQPGVVHIETPVGVVQALWHGGNAVSVTNVPSYRRAAKVTVEVPGHGSFEGNVAWGGNWFYLVDGQREDIALSNVEALADLSWKIRRALNTAGFPEVDHIELFGPPHAAGAQSRNFVLCPGKAYDRSPCGTGTSAKLACLAADGLLREGEPWVQESVVGSTFSGTYRWLDRAAGRIAPTITGAAFLTAETALLLDSRDPFCHGIKG